MKKQRKGYSVKQGRTRSAQSAVGGVFAMVFGVIWTVCAASIGAPWFFSLFGLCFVAMAGFNTYISYKNATGENRYSEYDVVDINDEPDPWDAKICGDVQDFNNYNSTNKSVKKQTSFCPYCGTAAEKDFEFCKNCGRKLPD